jgi:hypothetical protein
MSFFLAALGLALVVGALRGARLGAGSTRTPVRPGAHAPLRCRPSGAERRAA